MPAVQSIRAIRRKIRAVGNIKKITRAMQMVAAAKMRRAQAAVLATRPYSQKAWELLTFLAAQAQRGLDPASRERRPPSGFGLGHLHQLGRLLATNGRSQLHF